ncbi:alpha/beta fold hydrolase [Oricola thermophila]|uniref:Alpha/beta hydrolase n=1 Tax=Oricola thermophila TaxID=2742145 RepID=A0A6N1VD98_9HYPH|nr:alpha/beta hydrolase [Oricola thermophila]QKV18493.1 alpha/beta hydrolase [Oricola thermophila]
MSELGESVFFSAPDGLRLHAVDHGRGISDALPLVCLPGLSRNARDFAGFAEHFVTRAKPRRRVVCFDYRGRGLSEWDRNWKNYNVVTETEDLLAGMAALGITHAAIVGTSRGGLIAMTLAAMRPGIMRAVVLNDIGPVIEGDGLTQIRAVLSRAPKPSNWDEAIALQKATMAKHFPALTDQDWASETRAKYREVKGKIVPDHDPALVRTLTSIDLRDRLPTLWPQFMGLSSLPVLVLRGEHSNLLRHDTVQKMAKRHPDLRHVTIAGQGHAPLVHTAGIPELVEDFLKTRRR